jgi:hypothetical protein
MAMIAAASAVRAHCQPGLLRAVVTVAGAVVAVMP